MRSVIYSRTGGPDVLTLIDAPVPEPGPGEVRVRIHRAGVNPSDWKSRRGAGASVPVEPPQTPGQDGAGVIDAVGSDVDATWSGRRVWIWEAALLRPYGTAQDYALVPADQVAPLPESASFDLGASLGIPFLTAHRCLTVAEGGPARLGPATLAGRTVLVAGGAGAVGNAAIQLARWSDATVITTVSGPAKGALATAAGADHVIDYRQEDVATRVSSIAPNGVDIVVEVAPFANAELDTRILAPYGTVAAYASGAGGDLALSVRDLMGKNARWQFVVVYTMPPAAKRHAVEAVGAGLDDGAFRVGEAAGLPLHHFPLEAAADAHTAVEDAAVGKVLIDVTD